MKHEKRVSLKLAKKMTIFEFVGLDGSVWGSQRVDKMGNDGLDAS